VHWEGKYAFTRPVFGARLCTLFISAGRVESVTPSRSGPWPPCRGIVSATVNETRITYQGDPALVGVLVQMLEEEGVEVRWQPPEKRREVPGMVEPVVVNLVAVGALTGIKAAVQKFPGQFGSKVDVEGEDDEPPRFGRHRWPENASGG
jgi:hypothetical protein